MKKRHAINIRANGLGFSLMIVTSQRNIISAYQGNFLQCALIAGLIRQVAHFFKDSTGKYIVRNLSKAPSNVHVLPF